MAKLFSGKKEPEKKGITLSEEEEADADLATAMLVTLLSNPQMEKGLQELLSSAEPTMVLGQVVGTTIMKLKEQSMKNGIDLSDNIWLAKGGVADRAIDQLAVNLHAMGGPPVEDEAVYEETINIIKMASRAGKGGPPQPGQQPEPGAPAPQEAGPPMPAMGDPNSGGMM